MASGILHLPLLQLELLLSVLKTSILLEKCKHQLPGAGLNTECWPKWIQVQLQTNELCSQDGPCVRVNAQTSPVSPG